MRPTVTVRAAYEPGHPRTRPPAGPTPSGWPAGGFCREQDRRHKPGRAGWPGASNWGWWRPQYSRPKRRGEATLAIASVLKVTVWLPDQDPTMIREPCLGQGSRGLAAAPLAAVAV